MLFRSGISHISMVLKTVETRGESRRSRCPKEQLRPAQPRDPKRVFSEIRHHLPVDRGKPIDELEAQEMQHSATKEMQELARPSHTQGEEIPNRSNHNSRPLPEARAALSGDCVAAVRSHQSPTPPCN